MGLLDGKVVIITGAGGGIGREHALAMAKEGAKVVVNDLGGARDGTGGGAAMADKVVQEVKDAGGEAVANYDSVATMQGGENLFKTAMDAFGKVDILVNNAGILRDKTFMKMTEGEWDAVIAVHLKGTFCATKPVFAHLRERGEGGRIINTSSTSGMIGNFGQSNYGAAKAGIAGFTRVLALEGKKYGITVNSVVPTALTRMTDDLPGLKGIGDAIGPQCIPPVVVFLASDLAKDITGQFLNIVGKKLSLLVTVPTAEAESKGDVWTAQEISEHISKNLKT